MKKGNGQKIIIYITFCLVLVYLIYAVYLLIKEPTNKVIVEQRNTIFGRNEYWIYYTK